MNRPRRLRVLFFIFLFNATTRALAYISICLRAVLVSLAENFIHDHEPYTNTLNTKHKDGESIWWICNNIISKSTLQFHLQCDFPFTPSSLDFHCALPNTHRDSKRETEASWQQIISIDNTCYRSMLDLVFHSVAKMGTRVFKRNWYQFK